MPLDLEKANRERLIDYLKRKGESGLSSLRKEELLKMAKRAQRSAAKNHSSRSRSPHRSARRNSGRKHRGGEKDVPFIGSASDFVASDTLRRGDNAAVLEYSPERLEQAGGKNKKPRRKHKGGQQPSGATFLPARYFDAEAPLPTPNDANSKMTPYGQIHAVSGSCRNLAPFPNPTNQQTGGKKKKTPRRKHKGGEKLIKDETPAPARALFQEALIDKGLEAESGTETKELAQEIHEDEKLGHSQAGGKKKKPATKKPTTKKPATKKPAPKKPAPKKPAAKKPATPKRKKSMWDKLMGLF